MFASVALISALLGGAAAYEPFRFEESHHSSLMHDVKKYKAAHPEQFEGAAKSADSRNLRDAHKVDDIVFDLYLDSNCTMPSGMTHVIHGQYCIHEKEPTGVIKHFKAGCAWGEPGTTNAGYLMYDYAGYPDTDHECKGTPEFKMHIPHTDGDMWVMRDSCFRKDTHWAKARCDNKDRFMEDKGLHMLNFQGGPDGGCKDRSKKILPSRHHRSIRVGECFKDGAHKSIMPLSCNDQFATYVRYKDSAHCQGEHGKEKKFHYGRGCHESEDDELEDHDLFVDMEKMICVN